MTREIGTTVNHRERKSRPSISSPIARLSERAQCSDSRCAWMDKKYIMKREALGMSSGVCVCVFCMRLFHVDCWLRQRAECVPTFSPAGDLVIAFSLQFICSADFQLHCLLDRVWTCITRMCLKNWRKRCALLIKKVDFRFASQGMDVLRRL